ncbi:hypothetical protein RJ640_001143 [Escallonia rubra]|uniref:Uncharacterized protein n=1 Tax=Escallonia rubra TaxID=112253 RepID=A0AA88UI78_9ASTE|nr:hypothetical protein RJ640_001143 [Escallonia rubra]
MDEGERDGDTPNQKQMIMYTCKGSMNEGSVGGQALEGVLLWVARIIRTRFTFVLGIFFGVYAAQDYNVPNIHRLFNTGILIAKHCEENYRKPKGKDEADS